MNRLAGEKSPYLLQHAGNPVDWHPWGEEAFARARREDRPIFLSIGYSTCHWCHVMERESFEDPETARILNAAFVCVKVDREERPDVDSVYMTVCQMMTGHGGWPLTIVMTPGLEPFFAATYVPRQSRGGRIGLVDLVPRIRSLWEERRGDVLRSAAGIREALTKATALPLGREPGLEEMEAAYRSLRARFDPLRGGFGSAPKFPSPHNLLFLLRHAERTGDAAAREMVDLTLRRMRAGGIFDQLGSGFHRYSTDSRWLLPHFEKMLYDQALIALACAEASAALGAPEHGRTAREILSYVLRDLRDPAGGLRSAEDADSEGEEGLFYVWTEEQLRRVLDEQDLALAASYFGVERAGNFADEATGRRTGANVLHVTGTPAEAAVRVGQEPGTAAARLSAIRGRLLEARAGRVRPALDDKVLTDWNGMAIAALARCGAILGEPAFVDAAGHAAEFVLDQLRTPDGALLHRWRDGVAAIPSFAEDHAFLVWGLLELHAADGRPAWLSRAVDVAAALLARFEDPVGGGFFRTSADAEVLLVREKESHDGAVPSANSIAAWCLLRIGRLTGDPAWEEAGRRTLRAMAGRLAEAPAAHTALLWGVDFVLGPGREIVVVGEPGDPGTEALLAPVRARFLPRTVVLVRPPDGAPGAAEAVRLAPFTERMAPVEGRPAAYVCRDFACEAPTPDPGELAAALDGL
ncbi:MAG: thioredoxin domain-containing protein [Gemmatimonadota bacterium]